MSDTPRTDAFITQCETNHLTIWNALGEIQNHARQLERELAAYQAEMPEAPKVLDSLEALGAIHSIPLVAKADYDALAKRCARLTSEAKAFQMNYRLACDAETKRLTVELEAARKDTERYRLARLHIAPKPLCDSLRIPFPERNGRDTSVMVDDIIDTVLAAGKEKAE